MESVSAVPPDDAADRAWQEAYLRFETPAAEVRKFRRRLVDLGAGSWDRNLEVVELFCGRGSGLTALAGLGFRNIEGVDRSPSLVALYAGPGRCRVADCRELPFPTASKDVAVIQGGLHHLEDLRRDLDRTLAEARRVLRREGRLVVVEPWSTPFLRLVHRAIRVGLLRRAWPRLDALAAMIELEGEVYARWLREPDLVLALLREHFEPLHCRTRWGKLLFVGRPR